MSIRKLLRVAAGVAALVPFATCTDFTGPTGRGAQVPIIPSFGPAASFARAVYAAAGLEYDRVRVLITRNETEILKDTTVAFSPTSAELSLPLLLTANPGEVVTVTLEYRTADLVLYSGTQTVTTVATGAPAATPTPLVIIPVGPGAQAETIEISPASGSFPTTAPVSLTASAFKADHSPIADAIFAWSVDDPTVATVNLQGVVQPTSKGGATKVRATTINGKFGEATLTFVTPPASLAIQSGGNQSAPALDPLPAPVVVKVLDANGVPVPGATVNFAVATGGGSVSVINGVSNASGLVSASWTLGQPTGAQSITANAVALPNSPITINATATERPAKALVVGQQPLKSLMNASITPPVTIKAVDDKGHVVAGYTGAITLALDANPTSATLGGTLTANALAGVATFSNVTIDKAGEGYTLKATATGLTPVVSDAFGIDQVPAGLSLNAGGNQTKTIGSVLDQVVVKVADANGVGVAGVTVTFEVVSGGGSIVVNNAITDASGLARATWTLGPVIGTQSIRATSGTLNGSPLTINATGTALPAVALAFVQGPGTTAVNAAIAPAVTVRAIDANGNTVTGFSGAIALTLQNANTATLAGTTSANAVNGVATFADLSVNQVGSGYKLNATSSGLTAALSGSFTVTPGAAVGLAFKVQPSNVVKLTPISPAIEVKVVDAYGNTVTSATNAISLDFYYTGFGLDAGISGNGAVNAVGGVATFSNVVINGLLASIQLQAKADGLTTAISSTFAVTLPPAVAKTWTGAISNDWNNAGNWSPTGVPSEQDSVTIAATATQPLIVASAYANAILIESGASLQIISPTTITLTTARIYNRGTLSLTRVYLYGSLENRGTVQVDAYATVGPFTNVGTGSKLWIKSTLAEGASLQSFGTITNEGEIKLDDSDGYEAIIYGADSLVNKAGATILALQGSGGDRDIEAVLRNYGTITVSSSNGLYLAHSLPGTSSVNAGSITFTNGGDFWGYFPDTTAVFTNTGTIALGTANWLPISGKFVLKTGTVTGTGIFSTNYSALDIDFSKFSLMLNLDDGTKFPGDTLNVPSGQTVVLAGGYPMQRATVRGTLRSVNVGYGEPELQAGATVYSGGVIEAQHGLWIDSTFDIQSGGKLSVNASGQNVTVHVDRSMVNKGQVELTSAGGVYVPTLAVSGTLTNANVAGATVGAYAGSGGERRIEGVLDNKATVYVDPSVFLVLRGAAAHVNSGTIDLPDGTVGAAPADKNTKSFMLDGLGGSASLSNSGTIKIGANRALNIGTLTSVTNTSTGVVSGKGTIDQSAASTSFTNSGTIAPGGSGTVGTMTYKGTLSTTGTSKLAIDVSGTIFGTYDVLNVVGSANILGAVNVSFVAFTGTDLTYEVVTVTGSISGSVTVTGPGNPWNGAPDTNAQVLRISNVGIIFRQGIRPPM